MPSRRDRGGSTHRLDYASVAFNPTFTVGVDSLLAFRVRLGATMRPMQTAEESAQASVDGPLDVSIIIPCLNEETSVGECVKKALAWLSGSSFSGEVLVVDNGSTDGTAEAARAEGARVIAEPRRGKGNAFRTGVRESRGR